MANDAAGPLAPGTIVHKRYRILGIVGQGGLGTVYQVVDVIYGRQNVYALKELIDQSLGARKQFELESHWLQKLDHNHIPKVRENFEWQNRVYLVMDFVDGDNLEQIFAHNGGRPLPEREVLLWMLPIYDALQYLHTRIPPILHRDVKPSNIIVTPAGHPVLVDFGIAKEHQPGANLTATFVRKAGTEGYAPPEQYSAGGPTGPWSDVYGLGATLYQLLTGRIPPTAVERIALDAPMPHPRAINPALSPITDAAIWRALAIRPGDRYQSVLAFAQAIMPAVRELAPGIAEANGRTTGRLAGAGGPALGNARGSLEPEWLGAPSAANSGGLTGRTSFAGAPSRPGAPQSLPPQSLPPQRPPQSAPPYSPPFPPAPAAPFSGRLATREASAAPTVNPGLAMTRPVLPGPQGARTPPHSPTPLSPMPHSPTPLSSPTLAPPLFSGANAAEPQSRAGARSVTTPPLPASNAPTTQETATPSVAPIMARAWRGAARKRVAWGVGLLTLLIISIVVSVMVVRAFALPDRSTPHATITGYFGALSQQNDTLAWQYFAASRNDPSSQSSFISGLQSDDARYGRVESAHLQQIAQDTAGVASAIVVVSRASQPSNPITYSLSLTSYSGVWLIDNIETQ